MLPRLPAGQCQPWRRTLAAQPPSPPETERQGSKEYELKANSLAYQVGGLVGRGISSIRRRAIETGAVDAGAKLKDDGFKAAGVDKATGDTALKAAGCLWLAARTVHRVRKVAVGAVLAGAAYGVARAHSPQTADKVLEVGQVGLQKGQVLGSSFWSGVATGMGDETMVGQTAGDNVKVTSTGSGWGGSGSIEYFLRNEVRGLTPGGADYANAMRCEGYDSVGMLIQLAKDDRSQAAFTEASTDWSRMVSVCGVKAGDAVKIREALLQKAHRAE